MSATREAPDAIRPHHTEAAPAAIGPYSQAVSFGDLLFTSGQIALDPASGALVSGGLEAEARQVFRNLAAVLAAADCSFGDVLKATVYLVDMADFPALNTIYAEAFGGHKPARSTVAVAALPKGARVEIDLVARRH
jgi:2-iminobutanoate/2-iminopropanoate deaminase